MIDSYGTRTDIRVAGKSLVVSSLRVLARRFPPVRRLPYSLRILLENLLRHEDGATVTAEDIESLVRWDPRAEPSREIAFRPSRVLLQDFTGVPAIVDLAAMRDAMKAMGGDPARINPIQPVELVIDHSIQVDAFRQPDALAENTALEYQRNRERYAFLRWGQKAFRNFRVVPPSTGIIHQVNVECLARVVFEQETGGQRTAFPDTLVGTDSHTTMVNGLGVLGWGVGGIEAEAAMLGQPVAMLIPQVVGLRLHGQRRPEATATDVVLAVTQMLRKKGVVGQFVEFFGDGLAHLSLADRTTIANMAPEYGATCGFFPVDEETLRYLRLTGRSPGQAALVEAYCREQDLFHEPSTPDPVYSDVLELDLGSVEPCLAGPKQPHERVRLSDVPRSFRDALRDMSTPGTGKGSGPASPAPAADPAQLGDGAVVIAAITSCTNTSNPEVMIGAGLLARNAVQRGLSPKPWVKSSIAPGSRVVTDYLAAAGLLPHLEALGFRVVGYGCMTCIGNSGPLAEPVAQAVREKPMALVSVLSGNRNFEGRVHPDVRANYLASPPLVVAYALAGHVGIDLTRDPLGHDPAGKPVYLRDIWPSDAEVRETIRRTVTPDLFRKAYGDVFAGDDRWRSLPAPEGERYAWDPSSTYVCCPRFFSSVQPSPAPVTEIHGARVLCVLGDSVTTDHISPAGSISPKSPAGKYLVSKGVSPDDFNAYGARRGNHDVMMRGTFANVRLRNRLAPGTEGGVTRHLPDGQLMAIYDAAERYRSEGVPLVILAGKDYGSGSSRDWAAKGPRLLGVQATLAESYERIHRSNLIGMGVLPLQFRPGETAASLGLTGEEIFETAGLVEAMSRGLDGGREIAVKANCPDGSAKMFHVTVRLDSPQEVEYYRHGGILPYVLRQLLA